MVLNLLKSVIAQATRKNFTTSDQPLLLRRWIMWKSAGIIYFHWNMKSLLTRVRQNQVLTNQKMWTWRFSICRISPTKLNVTLTNKYLPVIQLKLKNLSPNLIAKWTTTLFKPQLNLITMKLTFLVVTNNNWVKNVTWI